MASDENVTLIMMVTSLNQKSQILHFVLKFPIGGLTKAFGTLNNYSVLDTISRKAPTSQFSKAEMIK